MERDCDGLTPQEAATRSRCTPDFIAGIKYAMRLAERDSTESLEELDALGDKARIEDYDELTSLASGASGVASKLNIRLFVMEGEGWIPDPDLLIEP